MTPEATGAAAVGRTIEVRDTLRREPSERLLDLLGRDDALGDALPPLAHWLHFHAPEPLEAAGPDGHPRRGDFLPALSHLPRRMWAGSDVTFHRPLPIGASALKRTTIESVESKTGRSGPLAFARLLHEVFVDDALAVTDRQTLVFREAPEGRTARMAPPDAPHTAWGRTVVPDAVTLFRYSALTWNSHRIHYDADYARDVEGYPDLVVHGPLLATLLADLASERGTLSRFRFQARAPLFRGDTVVLEGQKREDGEREDGERRGGAALVARAGAVAMEAAAEYR